MGLDKIIIYMSLVGILAFCALGAQAVAKERAVSTSARHCRFAAPKKMTYAEVQQMCTRQKALMQTSIENQKEQ